MKPFSVALSAVMLAMTAGPAESATQAPVPEVKQGGYLIVIRHGETDRSLLPREQRKPEPSPMNLADCEMQAKLTDRGRGDARMIGTAFRTLGIPVAQVLASGYCRTMETARLAFEHAQASDVLLHPAYKPMPGLTPLPPEYQQRLQSLKRFLTAAPPPGSNIVLVTHGENFRDLFGFEGATGEAVILKPDGQSRFDVVARVLPGAWLAATAQECLKAGCPPGQRAVHGIYQTADGIAIEGYDAVAYHTEGKATRGSARFEHAWQGARWQFASAANRNQFAADPERYAPEHGGYCNMAMTRNQLTASDPNAWAIVDGKLRLFASARGRDNFQKNTAANVELVARNWQALQPAK